MPMYFGYRAHGDHAVPFDDGMQRVWHRINQEGERHPELKAWIRDLRNKGWLARDIAVEYQRQMKALKKQQGTKPPETTTHRKRREALEAWERAKAGGVQ